MDDSQREHLRDLIASNNPDALILIYDSMGRQLYCHVLGLVGEEADAEDIMQDLFVRLAHNRRILMNAGNPEAYIFAMARNLAIDMMHRRKKNMISIDEYPQVLEYRATVTDSALNHRSLFKALLSLPIAQREIINMKCFGEMSFDAIARCLGISINTAASRYRYALNKLRRRVKEK
jgi:RNA polymerase sigma-70 factor (ECF subfamily)